jgi:hypothetical protein
VQSNRVTPVVDAAAGPPGDTRATPDGGLAGPPGCPDLFDQSVVHTYSFEIADNEWSAMVGEFNNLAALQIGTDFTVYHPIVFHLDGETVNGAVKLHGQSSWLETVMFDGAKAKMQFDVSFDHTDRSGNFHGLSKLIFDMPRTDWTFLHDRLAHAFLRDVGIMATCTASAKLVVNGQYYGLYVVEDDMGSHVVKQFFPDNSDGDLWKGGSQPETNKATLDLARKDAFWNATDLPSIAKIVDIQGSLTTWAAEALLNDADGYYGGSHNFLIYDQGSKGFIFLPQDTDSTFEYLVLFDRVGVLDPPVYWWEPRSQPAPEPGQHWVPVLADAGWRAKYADAIAAMISRWDVAKIQGQIDTWSAQIADAVATDPHAWAGPSDFKRAIAAARDEVAKRPPYLQTFVDCVHNGGADNDGDGYTWCADCWDDDPAIHPGARERCGNMVDDNCNGFVDEGCPSSHPDAGAPAGSAADAGAPAGGGPTTGGAPTTGGGGPDAAVAARHM